jgi:hypothetical protein
MPTSGSRLALHNTDWPRDSNNYHGAGGPADCLKIKGIVTANSLVSGRGGTRQADLHQGRAPLERAGWHADI